MHNPEPMPWKRAWDRVQAWKSTGVLPGVVPTAIPRASSIDLATRRPSPHAPWERGWLRFRNRIAPALLVLAKLLAVAFWSAVSVFLAVLVMVFIAWCEEQHHDSWLGYGVAFLIVALASGAVLFAEDGR